MKLHNKCRLWILRCLSLLTLVFGCTGVEGIQIDLWKTVITPGDREAVQLLRSNEFSRVIALAKGRLDKNPQDAQATLLLSLGYLGQGNDDQAMITAARAKASNPGRSLPVYGTMAKFYLAKGQVYRAMRCVRAAPKGVDDAGLSELMADIHMAQGQLGKARALLESLQEGRPPSLNLARLYLLQGEYELAIKIAEKLVKAPQEARPATTILGSCFLVTDQLDRARASYEKLNSLSQDHPLAQFHLALIDLAEQKWDRAESRLASLSTTKGQDWEAKVALAIARLGQGRLAEAKTAAEAAIGLNQQQPLGHLVLGFTALGLKEFKKADQSLGNASALFVEFGVQQFQSREWLTQGGPNLPRLVCLSTLLLNQGLFRTTLRVTGSAASPARSHPVLEVTKARAYVGVGDLKQARQIYSSLVDKEPLLVTPAVELGSLASREAKWREAVRWYQEALKRHPDSPFLQLRLGDSLNQLGDADAAISTYKKVIAAAPNAALAYNQLGWTLAHKKGELAQAQKMAEKACELAPQDISGNDTLGWIYFQQGRFPDAARVYSRIWQAPIQDPKIYYRMGLACRKTGDTKKSLECFEKALNLSDDFPGAAEAVSFLKIPE